jgi:predicted permease
MLLDTLLQDFSYSVRQLRRNPIFTFTAILTLAIGIGANTTVFTAANALLFRDPVGVDHPEHLIDIGFSFKGQGFGSGSYPDYLDIARRATTLDGVYAHPRFPHAMSLGNDRVFAMEVSANFFSVLGVVPSAGRLMIPGDADTVVLSHRFWIARFNKNPDVIGRTLRLNDTAFIVVGVATDGFQGTGIRSADLWIPLHESANRGVSSLIMGARLKPGGSVGKASTELAAIGKALQQEYPVENKDRGILAESLSPVPGETTPIAAFLVLLGVIVMLVLTIACANVSGVMLARAAARRREIAVRVAIGAGRGRIVMELLTETILLFAIGATAGLAIARGLTSLIVSQLPSLPFPINVTFALDSRVVLFVVGLSLLAALLSGLAPSRQATKADVLSALKDESRQVLGRLRLRHAFVVVQVALSILLIVTAGLFVRALQHAMSGDPGFDPKGVELASLDMQPAGYTETTAPRFLREIVDRVRALPAVEAATVAAVLPGGFEGIGLGALSVDAGTLLSPVWNIVEPGYFATLHMSLLAGRDIGPDDRNGAQDVVILGEAAARKFWPGREAVGQFVQQTSYSPIGLKRRTLRVIGVARDPKFGSLVDGTTGIYAYVPLQQQYLRGITPMIAARSIQGRRLTNEIRAVVTAASPNAPFVTPQTAEDYAALGLAPQRVVASLSGSLGLVGLLLAAIGLYGVMMYMVTRRTREIGIRVALGASRLAVIVMVLKQGMSLVVVGTIAGLVLGAAASQALTVLLFGIPPLDPVVFSTSAVLFAITGIAACYVPARRATQIEPAIALRDE